MLEFFKSRSVPRRRVADLRFARRWLVLEIGTVSRLLGTMPDISFLGRCLQVGREHFGGALPPSVGTFPVRLGSPTLCCNAPEFHRVAPAPSPRTTVSATAPPATSPVPRRP